MLWQIKQFGTIPYLRSALPFSHFAKSIYVFVITSPLLLYISFSFSPAVIFLLVGGKTVLDGDQQTFLLAARQLGMTAEDGHVFIVIEPFPDPGFTSPWQPLLSPYANETVEGDVTAEEALTEAYRAVLMVTMR